jgi:hypothetical protein
LFLSSQTDEQTPCLLLHIGFDNLFSPMLLVRVTFIPIWEYIFRLGSTNGWVCDPAWEILDEVHKPNWMILPEDSLDPQNIHFFRAFRALEESWTSGSPTRGFVLKIRYYT